MLQSAASPVIISPGKSKHGGVPPFSSGGVDDAPQTKERGDEDGYLLGIIPVLYTARRPGRPVLPGIQRPGQ